MIEETVKMRAGNIYIPVKITYKDNIATFHFGFNRALMSEIKALERRKFNWDDKTWNAPLTDRNLTALDFLRKDRPNPFTRLIKPIEHFEPARELWDHQQEMLNFIMTKRCGILAATMGTGKSLVLIEAMELSGFDENDIWYVSTKGALVAMRAELKKWGSKIMPRLFTFDNLRKEAETWKDGNLVPRMIIGDESSRLKNMSAGRTKAFKNFADLMRYTYEDCYVIEATGTPAPLKPMDWWSQCEIAFPAFLKEGNEKLLETTLSLMEYKENEIGQRFGERVTFWDDENKCQKCGELESNHTAQHDHEKSVNEIERLGRRLSPLVKIVLKSDVLSYLPDKHYRVIKCTPSDEVLRTARTIASNNEGAEALIKLRALSDGFQYTMEESGKAKCSVCGGDGSLEAYVVDEEEEESWEDIPEFYGEKEETECFRCSGTGDMPVYKRTYLEIPCPKYEALESILNDHEDGRLVVFAAFHASMDKIEKFCFNKGWATLKVDGRGWFFHSLSGDKITDPTEMIEAFQDPEKKFQKLVFIAHPKSGGMGLTLTASCETVFFSNPFNGEDRMQAEDRCHRPGMDLNKGLTITDLYNLPSDKYVKENLTKKKFLQAVTMADLKAVMETQEKDNVESLQTSTILE